MLAHGSKLGPYEIVAPLGAGGMGEVYRARDTRLGREVALKVLPQAAPYEQSRLRRFEQEARALATLNHPNLLVIHDVGDADGIPYLASELLTGEPLDVRLRQGAIAPRKAVELARQMAAGLAAAHEQGIVHRDLKPANLFVTNDGRVKILDFGLAKLTETVSAEAVTQALPNDAATASGVTLGTVGYMSPEQVKGETVDARTDIFSFGAVLYEMLTGQRAFKRDSAAETMTAILREEPAENPATAPTSAPALDKIIRRCLEKQPRQRFQSANDLGIALELALGSTMTSGQAPIVAAPRNRAWLLIAAAMVIAAASAGLTRWLLGGASAPPEFQAVTFQQGTIASARFLPDGQGVVLAAAWNNNPIGLYTGRLDSSGLQGLPAPGVSKVLAMAHGEVALLLNQHLLPGYAGFGTLARMPLSGGAPRPVLDNVQYADYRPGSTDLAVIRYHPESSDFTLEYPIGHVLYRDAWLSDLRFSRDGARIGFIDHPDFGDDYGYVAVTDLAGHEKQLTEKFSAAQGLAWSPSDREIWFSAAVNGNHDAVRAVTLGGQVRELATAPEDLYLDDVLTDGRVLTSGQNTRISTSLFTPLQSHPLDLTVLDWGNRSVLSANGQHALIGDETAGPRYATFLRTADGAPPIRLGDGDPVGLSPDGQWAVSDRPDTQQLMLLPTGTGEPRQLTHGKIAYAPLPVSWLSDGHALIALGIAPGEAARDYEVSLSDGSARPITPPGVEGTLLTPDGQAVVAHARGQAFARYPLAGGPPRPIAGLQATDGPMRFANDGRSLFVQRNSATEVWRLDLASGQATHLFTVAPQAPAGVSASAVSNISADGKSYTVITVQRLSTLYLLTGLR